MNLKSKKQDKLKNKIRIYKLNLNISQIIKLYKLGKSTQEISIIFNCSRRTIEVRLRNNGIKLRGYKTHGKTKTRLYSIWATMKARCYNVNNTKYTRYGGRGITICNEWKNDFQIFYDWSMKNGYKQNLSIDRINNDGNYEPSNCRWVTNSIQANNRKSTRLFKYKEKNKTLREWSDDLNINFQTLASRIVRRWTLEDTLFTPVRGRND